eukprot:scaffold24070_cov62-Phaeocystis_antarctica.AAC.1
MARPEASQAAPEFRPGLQGDRELSHFRTGAPPSFHAADPHRTLAARFPRPPTATAAAAPELGAIAAEADAEAAELDRLWDGRDVARGAKGDAGCGQRVGGRAWGSSMVGVCLLRANRFREEVRGLSGDRLNLGSRGGGAYYIKYFFLSRGTVTFPPGINFVFDGKEKFSPLVPTLHSLRTAPEVRGAHLRIDTRRVLKTGCRRARVLAEGVLVVCERRTAAVRRTGRPRGRTVPRGRWPSPARPRTARRASISPACCVRRAADDGQAAHGRPGQQRPIRPLAASLASWCPISSPWAVARGRRWWQRAYEPTLWQATVVVRPMRQHSCHRAAAWSSRRAGRRQCFGTTTAT